MSSTGVGGGEGRFVTIADEPADFKQKDELELLDKVDRKEQELQKELRKKKKPQTLEEERGKYFEQYFYCVGCKAEIDKFHDLGGLQYHHNNCPYYLSHAVERKQQEQSQIDGRLKMRYRLHFILEADADIERLRQRLTSPETLEAEKKYIMRDIKEAELTKQSHLVQKHKLLSQSINEYERLGAQGEFDKYIKLTTEKQRRREYHVF